jgi:hypothetical protein
LNYIAGGDLLNLVPPETPRNQALVADLIVLMYSAK